MENAYFNSVLNFKVYLYLIQENKNTLLINQRKEEK
jgi:hypothetical protein